MRGPSAAAGGAGHCDGTAVKDEGDTNETKILMCLAVLLLLSGMGAASASDVLAAQSEALDLDALLGGM